MKCCIIDACFPVDNQSFGMAALWLIWYCGVLKIEVSSASISDCILVTCVDPRNWNVLKSLRKRYPTKKIYAGGAGALAPYSLGLHCDAVCVGNGERFIKTLSEFGHDGIKDLPETWIGGQSRSVFVAEGFPWNCPPIECEDGAYRVWCGRGCKKKCLFCQTGWATKYEENPDGKKLLESIKALQKRNKKFAYLSNDPNQHSFSALLPKIDHGSYSLDFIRSNGLPSARQIRLGVEGPSERLRSFVNKPISKSDLVRATAWMNSNGKSIRWFMIAGLPTENDADWEELKETVIEWKKTTIKGVLALSFTAWQPEPSTPLGAFGFDDSYWKRWENFREWFFGGAGWSNRIKLMQPANPKTRIESAMARMGLADDKLREGGCWGPNDRVEYPFKKQRNAIYERLIQTQ